MIWDRGGGGDQKVSELIQKRDDDLFYVEKLSRARQGQDAHDAGCQPGEDGLHRHSHGFVQGKIAAVLLEDVDRGGDFRSFKAAAISTDRICP